MRQFIFFILFFLFSISNASSINNTNTHNNAHGTPYSLNIEQQNNFNYEFNDLHIQSLNQPLIIYWLYNHSNSPYEFYDVLSSLNFAISVWEEKCNVKFIYKGQTTKKPLVSISEFNDSLLNQNVIGWREFKNDPYFSHLDASTTTINPINTDQIVEAYTALNYTKKFPLNYLKALFIHELGHFIGLNHTKVSAQVMSFPYSSVIEMSKLGQDDISQCRKINSTWQKIHN